MQSSAGPIVIGSLREAICDVVATGRCRVERGKAPGRGRSSVRRRGLSRGRYVVVGQGSKRSARSHRPTLPVDGGERLGFGSAAMMAGCLKGRLLGGLLLRQHPLGLRGLAADHRAADRKVVAQMDEVGAAASGRGCRVRRPHPAPAQDRARPSAAPPRARRRACGAHRSPHRSCVRSAPARVPSASRSAPSLR